MRRLHGGRLAALLFLLLATGCGFGGADADTAEGADLPPAPQMTTERTATGAAADDRLRVLVVGVDGPDAPGLDAAVTTLLGHPGTAVRAVTPEFAGAANARTATTMTGYPVRVLRGGLHYILDGTDGLDDPPDLVVVGVTEGDAVGSATQTSPAVEIARQASAQGIPAVVVAAGGSEPDYAAASLELASLLDLELDRLLSSPAASVLAVPSCDEGSVRGRVDVRITTESTSPAHIDCSSTEPATGVDVDAHARGFSTLATLPD